EEADMNANNDARSTRSAAGMPRWVAAMIVLQGLTLAAAFGLRPEAAPAEATGVMAQQDRDVLPNAASQRAEQIRLLKQIADQMGAMNDKLDRLNRTMENQAGNQGAGN